MSNTEIPTVLADLLLRLLAAFPGDDSLKNVKITSDGRVRTVPKTKTLFVRDENRKIVVQSGRLQTKKVQQPMTVKQFRQKVDCSLSSLLFNNLELFAYVMSHIFPIQVAKIMLDFLGTIPSDNPTIDELLNLAAGITKVNNAPKEIFAVMKVFTGEVRLNGRVVSLSDAIFTQNKGCPWVKTSHPVQAVNYKNRVDESFLTLVGKNPMLLSCVLAHMMRKEQAIFLRLSRMFLEAMTI